MEEIYQTFLKSTTDELKEAARKLNEKCPAPMNEMLQKQPRDEALQKRQERGKMVAKDVPPTTPGIICICGVSAAITEVCVSMLLPAPPPPHPDSHNPPHCFPMGGVDSLNSVPSLSGSQPTHGQILF